MHVRKLKIAETHILLKYKSILVILKFSNMHILEVRSRFVLLVKNSVRKCKCK